MPPESFSRLALATSRIFCFHLVLDYVMFIFAINSLPYSSISDISICLSYMCFSFCYDKRKIKHFGDLKSIFLKMDLSQTF